MNLAALQTWGKKIQEWKSISQKPWFYPAALLLIGLIPYAYQIASLGYYWDDWEVVFLLNSRSLPLLYGYFAYDRPFAWPYQLMYALVGLNPIAWHLITLLLRWAGTLLLYLSLRQLWPRYETVLRWGGALLLLYPGFFQQSISAAYNRHLTAFFLFGLSIYLMTLAVRNPRQAWLLFPLSWITAFVQMFTIEYFVGLELIRPALLWILLSNEEAERGKALRKAALFSLPYLILLGFYSWWRVVIFPATIAKLNYAGDYHMLADFKTSFLAGMLALLTRAFSDFAYSTFHVWLTGLTAQDSFTFQGKALWLAFALGLLVAGGFALFQRLDAAGETDAAPEASEGHQTPLAIFLVGLWAFLVSSLPVWLTNKQLSGGGRWDDRFALSTMTGAVLITLAGVLWLVRPRHRALVLGLLLFLAAATQALIVNKYRTDWEAQRDYYWQLAWRVPALEPHTAIISFEQPAASIPGYDASFALNVLFNGRIEDGATPYWFFTNDRFLNFKLIPGQEIAYDDRNLKFTGNTSEAIAIVRQGSNRCLQVLDGVYTGEPFYQAGQEQLIGVSNVGRILPDASGDPPDAQIFGSEPPHGWCYYFEKAELARQMGDWQTVLKLEKQAKQAGLAPGFAPEYLPFIEAHARSGDWQKAYELSLSAQRTTKGIEPFLCGTWQRLSALPGADVHVVSQARQSFACVSQ